MQQPNPPDPKHKRQTLWQIFIPLALGVLILLAVSVLVTVRAGTQAEIVHTGASVTALFFILPTCIGGIIMLALLLLLIVGVNKLLRVTTPYLRAGQAYVAAAGIYIQMALDKAASPAIAVRSRNASWKAFWRGIFPKRP